MTELDELAKQIEANKRSDSLVYCITSVRRLIPEVEKNFGYDAAVYLAGTLRELEKLRRMERAAEQPAGEATR